MCTKTCTTTVETIFLCFCVSGDHDVMFVSERLYKIYFVEVQVSSQKFFTERKTMTNNFFCCLITPLFAAW